MNDLALAFLIASMGGICLAIAVFCLVYWFKGRKRKPPSEPGWDFAKEKPLPKNTGDTVVFRRHMPANLHGKAQRGSAVSVGELRRAPRAFDDNELGAFADHWQKALDQLTPFRERIGHSVRACRTLFPGEPIVGYWKPVKQLLDERAPPFKAMRVLWEEPIPQSTDSQREAAHLNELVRAAEARAA